MDAINNRTPFRKWKPIEIMLAVLFLVAPFYYHPNIGGEGLRIPNNITVWMIATIIIGYSLHLVLKRPTFVIPKYFAYIAAFPILITLSGFVTGVEQPLKWLFRLLFIWGGLAFFFSLFQHRLKQGRLDRLLFIIVISALLQGLVGVAQIWLQTDMPFWLPKSSNGVPSGLFQQINNQATYQVTGIMIVAYLITRPFIRFAKPWLKSLLILSVLCASFLVAVSGSRIGALTLILGLLIIIPSQWQRFKKNKKIAFIAIAALVTGISVGIIQGNSRVIDKTVAMQSGYSSSARLSIYNIAVGLIKEQPIFGHGIGSFGREFQFARPDFYAEHPDAVLPNQYVSHPHNEVMFWLVEGGLIAGVGLLAVVIGVILAVKQLGWRRGGAYITMLLPVGLHTQVELPLSASGYHWFLLLTLFVMVSQHQISIKTKTITASLTRLINAMMVIVAIIFLVFFTHTLRAQHDFIEFYQKLNLEKPAFPYALNNPYLAVEGRWLMMSEYLYSSMNLGLQNNVEQYTVWGQQRLIVKPTVELYVKLVDAYRFLDNKEAYCVTAEQGIAMYPQAEPLKLAQNFCQY